MVPVRLVGLCLLVSCFRAQIAFAQMPDSVATDIIRVRVSMNSDGSRTTYEFDAANHKAVATTTERDGKVRGKIRYTLDKAGRFAKGDVFGPDERLRFKAVYKYDGSGNLIQELQLGKDDAVMHKIVYSYDGVGRQTSYSVYDASGKLISQTKASNSSGTSAKKKSR